MGPEYGACGNDLRSFLKTAYQQLLELLDEDFCFGLYLLILFLQILRICCKSITKTAYPSAYSCANNRVCS